MDNVSQYKSRSFISFKFCIALVDQNLKSEVIDRQRFEKLQPT